MTDDQSRELKNRRPRLLRIHSNRSWLGTCWSGVTVDWGDKHASSIHHNDIAQVERVPLKIMRGRERLIPLLEDEWSGPGRTTKQAGRQRR